MPIGTAAAIAIGLGTAGAQTAASIYGTKKAADVNKSSLAAQERSDLRAAEEARADRELREREYTAALEADKARWADYTRINEPYWQAGARVLGSLYDMAGTGSPVAVPPPSPAALGAAPTVRPLASLPALASGGGPSGPVPAPRPTAVSTPMPNTQTSVNLAPLMNLATLARRPAPTV